MPAIGHTATGKPIHAAPADHPAYAGFNPRDHQDAARAHRLEAAKAIMGQNDHQEAARMATGQGDHSGAQAHAQAGELEGHRARQHDTFMRDHVARLQGGDPMQQQAGMAPAQQQPMAGGARRPPMAAPTAPQGPMGKSLTEWIEKSLPTPPRSEVESEHRSLQKSTSPEGKSMSLETWFEKSEQAMPTGKPGLDSGVEVQSKENGGKVAGKGKSGKSAKVESMEGRVGSSRPAETEGDAPGVGAGYGKLEVLSDDDHPIKPMAKAFDEEHARRVYLSRLAKGDDDLVIGVGVSTPVEQVVPTVVEKSAEWTHGVVHYDCSEDDRISRMLEKSDGFYEGFDAPALSFQSPLQKSETCGMCKSLKPLMLSVCPHCGTGDTLGKSAHPEQVRGLPGRRTLSRGADMHFPGGLMSTK